MHFGWSLRTETRDQLNYYYWCVSCRRFFAYHSFRCMLMLRKSKETQKAKRRRKNARLRPGLGGGKFRVVPTTRSKCNRKFSLAFFFCFIVRAKELFPSTTASKFDWMKEITFFRLYLIQTSLRKSLIFCISYFLWARRKVGYPRSNSWSVVNFFLSLGLLALIRGNPVLKCFIPISILVLSLVCWFCLVTPVSPLQQY